MTNYRQLLVPTDFSEISQAALEHAKRLADAFHSTLHLLHVLEDPLSHVAIADGYALGEDFVQGVEKEARERLGGILTAPEQLMYRTQLALREGSPFVEIVRYAKQKEIDLIVMGTHGRGPIAHMLLGSVAEQVLRKAPCPVLVVRNPKQQFVMP